MPAFFPLTIFRPTIFLFSPFFFFCSSGTPVDELEFWLLNLPFHFLFTDWTSNLISPHAWVFASSGVSWGKAPLNYPLLDFSGGKSWFLGSAPALPQAAVVGLWEGAVSPLGVAQVSSVNEHWGPALSSRLGPCALLVYLAKAMNPSEYKIFSCKPKNSFCCYFIDIGGTREELWKPQKQSQVTNKSHCVESHCRTPRVPVWFVARSWPQDSTQLFLSLRMKRCKYYVTMCSYTQHKYTKVYKNHNLYGFSNLSIQLPSKYVVSDNDPLGPIC